MGSAILRLSGYAMSDETDQLDLFVSLYSGVDDVTPIGDTETKTAAEQCLRFLAKCADGRLAKTMDESDDRMHSRSLFKIATPISTRSGYTSSRIGKQRPRILSREKLVARL